MKCQYCGEELSGGRFCTNCGAPAPENPAAFPPEQQIPEPTVRQIPTPVQPVPEPTMQQAPTPVQQVPEPTEWIPAPAQQTPSQPGAPGKKPLKPGVIVAIVLGVLLVVVLAVVLLTRKPQGTAETGDPVEQTRQLIQYAESKAWLEDCTIEESELAGGDDVDHTLYYIRDFDNDGWLEMLVTAFDSQGKTAQSMLYAFLDGQLKLWTDHSYTAEDSDLRIINMALAGKEGFSGFAVYFTVIGEDEYPYLGVLQLADNTLTEIDYAAGADECAAYMSDNGWELLSGTPIAITDDTPAGVTITTEELAALTELYDPQNAPDDGGMLKLVDGTVYAVEQSGLYRFMYGQKQTVGTAPEGIIFSPGAGFLYNNDRFYVLGLKDLADGSQERQIYRVNVNAGTTELLFTLPGRGTLLKADSQRIYVQTSSGDGDTLGEITVYDHRGKVVKTLPTPQIWATNGTIVMGINQGRTCVVTAEGQYLLENIPVQDAKLVDGSVYYLTGDGTSVTLYRLDSSGNVAAVGTLSPCAGANFRRRAGSWLVEVSEDAQNTYYSLDRLERAYSDQNIIAMLPEASSVAYVDFMRDAVTGEAYLMTAYAPHGNSGPLYRVRNGQFELLRNREEEIFYWMVYDDTVYFGRKDYSNGEPYMQAPVIADCLSVEALSQ